MRQFFNKILKAGKDLFTLKVDKHQKYLAFGTLLFGLLCNIIFGTLLSVILMLLFAFFAEFCYCFVPTKNATLFGKEIIVTDLKGFFTIPMEYIAFPKHDFKLGNFYYVVLIAIVFMIIKMLF